MKLCGPNMSESGGSLCRVKQFPRHGVPLCRLQAGGHHLHNLPQLSQQPWVEHPTPAAASSPAEAARHRANGAAMAGWGREESEAFRLGEEATVGRAEASTGKVLVTGGGGYFGSKLGTELARQGMSVILLDIYKPPCEIPDGAVFCQV